MKRKLLTTLLILASVFNCGIALTACGENTPKHTHKYDQRVEKGEYLAQEADCTHKAVYYYSCECGEKGEQTFESGEPKGHSFINYKYNNDATCTSDGTKTAKCEYCTQTDTVKDETHLKTAHTFTQEKAEAKYLKSEATCTHKAVYYKSCPSCDLASETETFESGEPNGHAFTQEVAADKYLKSEATCTHKAVYYKSCADCGEKGTETFESGEPNGHSFTQEKTEIKYLKSEADCTHKAVYYKSCADCGEKGTETFEGGEPNGHSFTQEKAEAKYLKSEADCTHKAVYYKSCSVCGLASNTETYESGEPNGHSFKNRKCEVCNIDQPVSSGLQLYLKDDNTYTITGIGECKDKQLLLPEVYEDKRVTGIGSEAFSGLDITEVIIPESYEIIGNEAFKDCTELTSVNIPGGQNKSENYLGEKIFWSCTALTDAVIGEGVKKISTNLFWGCVNLENVNIPDSVTDMELGAFHNCKAVKEEGGLRYIGKWVTGSCNDHASITIRDDTVGIATYAIASAVVKWITIPDSVKYICKNAFSQSENLETIEIGKGVTKLGYRLAGSCPKLKSITYKGTMQEWKDLCPYSSNPMYGLPLEAVIICSDGKLDKNGNEITE